MMEKAHKYDCRISENPISHMTFFEKKKQKSKKQISDHIYII